MNMLRSIREKKGLTLGQLAARASIPTRVLAEYEEGRQPISLPHAKLIAKALWVQIEDLLPPAGSAPPPSYGPASSPPSPPQPMQAPPRERPQEQQPAISPAPPAATPPVQRPVPAQPGFGSRDHAPAQSGQGAPRSYEGGSRGYEGGHRGYEGGPQGRGPGGPPPRRGDPRGPKPVKPPAPPPKPITEGQVEELMRLAARLEAEQSQLEERIGKPFSELTRPEAKDWIKRLRAMADEIAPSGRVRFGQWPGAREDREAVYLTQQRDTTAQITFKLFNGEEFTGTIADFTPYTITIRSDGSEVVLRKLAIAYYRQVAVDGVAPAADQEQPARQAAAEASEAAPRKRTSAKAKQEAQQAEQLAAADVGSDRPSAPQTPEVDNMDEDRGL